VWVWVPSTLALSALGMPGSAPKLDKYPRPPPGPRTVEQQAEARARRGKGASVSGLTFPPLTKDWTCKSEASWPGAEYSRRTRLKNKLDPTWHLGKPFVDEMEELLGDDFHHWEDSMKPSVKANAHRGLPPSEKGDRPIQPSYVLRRAEPIDDLGAPLTIDLKGTTMSLSGHISKSRENETSYTKFGPVPSYLFEDREKMSSMSQWFEKYGRPTPNAINLGPRQLYTHYQNSSKRCCGEASHVQRMIKGVVTK